VSSYLWTQISSDRLKLAEFAFCQKTLSMCSYQCQRVIPLSAQLLPPSQFFILGEYSSTQEQHPKGIILPFPCLKPWINCSCCAPKLQRLGKILINVQTSFPELSDFVNHLLFQFFDIFRIKEPLVRLSFSGNILRFKQLLDLKPDLVSVPSIFRKQVPSIFNYHIQI